MGFFGVTLGLMIGKPLGILTMSWLAVRIGAAMTSGFGGHTSASSAWWAAKVSRWRSLLRRCVSARPAFGNSDICDPLRLQCDCCTGTGHWLSNSES